MAREATDGLYIELDYYTPENYHTYTAEASMISGEYIDNGYIDLDYFQPGEGTGLFALTCDLTEVVGELKEFAGALSVVASTAPSAVKTVVVDTSLTVTATQSSTVGIIKQGAVALTGAFSPSISAVAILRPDVFLESSVSFAATAVKTTSNEVILSYLASLDAQAARTRAYDSALSASFDTSTTANSTKPFSAALQSTFTIPSIDTDAFKSVSANLSNTFTTSITGKALCERPLAADIDNAIYSTFGSMGPAFGTYGAQVYGTKSLEYIVCREAMPDNSTEWFAEGWIAKSSVTQESTFFSLMYDEDKTTANKEIFFFGDVNGKKASVTVRNDTTVSNEIDTVDGAVTSQWKHFVFGWKPGSGAKLWLDGSLLLTEDDITSVTVRNNKFGRLLFGRKYQGDTYTDNTSWLDEFRIVKGAGVLDKYGYAWSSTSITEPTSAFTDTTDTKLLLHFENNSTDDFIAGLASADLSVSATVSAGVENIKQFASAISATATATTSGDLILEGGAALTSQATLSSTIGSIKTFEAALTNAFTPSIVASAVKNSFAILDTNTTLTVSGKLTQGLASAVVASASLVVVAKRIRLGVANPNSAFTVNATADGVLRDYSAAISSAFTVEAEPDTDHLQLYAGATISSTGTTILDSLDNSESAYQTGAVTNFWLKLSDHMTNNTSLTLYQSNSSGYAQGYSRIFLTRQGATSQYRLLVETYYRGTIDLTYNDPGDHPYYYTGAFRSIDLASDFDPRQWHNIHMPLALPLDFFINTVDDPGEISPTVGDPLEGNWWAIDGDDNYSVTVDAYVNPTHLGDAPGVLLSSDSGNAGVWGDTNTNLDIFIDNFWAKNWDARYHVSPYSLEGSDFYALGREPYGNNGTVGGVTPEIYHDWEDGLLESANNVSPTWDYVVASGDVRTGLVIEGSASISVSATAVTIGAMAALASASISVSATSATDGIRIRFADSAMIVSATSSPTAVKTTDVDSAMSTAITLTATAVKTTDVDSSLDNTFTIVIDNVRAKLFEPSLSSAFTMPDVDAVSTRGLAVAIDSAATVNAQPLRIKQLGASLTGAFSPSIDANAILRPDVFLETSTNVTTDAVIFAGAQSTVSSAFTLTVQAERTVDYVADLSVTATIPNANIFRIQQFEMSLASAFTTNVDYIRYREFNVALDLSVTTQLTPLILRSFEIQLNTAVSLQALPQLLVEAGADITAQFEDTFVVTRLRKAEADLSVFGFSVTVGDIINIDPFRQLIVPSETRFIKVSQETRRVVVPSETRILEV